MSLLRRLPLVELLLRFASRLRFPQLFLLLLALALIDFFVPDPIPFLDELLLALGALLVASMKKEKDPDEVDADWRED